MLHVFADKLSVSFIVRGSKEMDRVPVTIFILDGVSLFTGFDWKHRMQSEPLKL